MILHFKPFSLLLVLILLVVITQAQETSKFNIKKKLECYTIKETFYALKPDSGIKHGKYTRSISYYSEKGQYDHGKKTGVWECLVDGKPVTLQLQIIISFMLA